MTVHRTTVQGHFRGFFQGLFAAAALSVSACASAAEPGFYFGVQGGRADYDFELPQFGLLDPTPQLGVPGLRPFPPGGGFGGIAVGPLIPGFWIPRKDEEETAWGALIGYRVNRYFAAELGYHHLGTLEVTDRVYVGPIFGPLTPVPLERELETEGPAISVLGMLPFFEGWEAYLRGGVIFLDSTLRSSFQSTRLRTTFGSDSLLWGGGVQWHAGKRWSVRAEFQRFESVGSRMSTGEPDIDLLSLNVLYRL